MIKVINKSKQLTDSQVTKAVEFVIDNASPLFHLKLSKKVHVIKIVDGFRSDCDTGKVQYQVGWDAKHIMIYVDDFKQYPKRDNEVPSFCASVAHELGEVAGYSHRDMVHFDKIDNCKGRMMFYGWNYWTRKAKNFNWKNIDRY